MLSSFIEIVSIMFYDEMSCLLKSIPSSDNNDQFNICRRVTFIEQVVES